MRISINLATQHYEDHRAFVIRWLGITAAVLAITIGLITLATMRWQDRRQLDRELAQINNQRLELQRERQQTEAVLNQPQNRGTRDHAQFLNGLILRKTFSWTSVFSELEHILPASVRVTAIRPEVDQNNHLNIRVSVESESRTAALEFIRRIEETRDFRDPHLLNERHGSAAENGGGEAVNVNQAQNPNAVTYEISAEYVPGKSSEGTR
jgi:Tfp pilus assembly protein PilN